MRDRRLDVDLALLRLVLGAYLARLREVWGTAEANDVERIIAAVGIRATPSRAELHLAMRLLREARSVEEGPLAAIVRELELSEGEEIAVTAAWWAEADPQLAVVLGCAHDDGARRYASASLLRLGLEPFGIAASPAFDDSGRLVRWGVFAPGAGSSGALTLTPTARLLMAGLSPEPLEVAGGVPRRLAQARTALARHLAAGTAGVVLLRGPTGVGRRALAVAAAAEAGRIPIGPDRPGPELRLLARLGVGTPVVPAELLADLEWAPEDGPLVAWGPAGHPAAGSYVVELSPPNDRERANRWRRSLERAGLPRDNAKSLAPLIAARFTFTEGDIDTTLERAGLDASWTGRPLDGELVWEAARRQSEHGLERLAALITPSFTLDDLVLPDDTAEKLRELVAHVALKHVVLDRWGFRSRMPRGQGVVALLSGPPGTGKTMAAEAIAHALHQDLFRVDLSAVVSKYVGQTESNLSTAFAEAERGSAVLFFDEADALFSKRTTQVRDAHDHYVNLGVSYLLQRVETFTGLVILATNRASVLDEAFLRRLRFSIRFEMPNASLRRELWRRSFPPEARVAALDWSALAGAELAGGSIQSAALSAAFLAAAEDGRITAAHVEHALRREYEKLGKAWPGALVGAAA